MDVGIGLVGDYSAAETASLARTVDGLTDCFWLPDERFQRDVFVRLAAVGQATSDLRVGTAVTDPYVRHPLLTAVSAATLAEATGGRFILGIGAGDSGFRALGIERRRPVETVRESVSVIRRFLRGERIDSMGTITARGASLGFQIATPPPIYVAGRGPRMLELAGETGDGVIVGGLASGDALRWALKHVSEGTERRKRDQPPDIVLWTPVSIGPRSLALEAVRPAVAVALWSSLPALDTIGVRLSPSIIRLMSKEHHTGNRGVLERVAQELPEEVLDTFSIAGTAEEIAERLRQTRQLGVHRIAAWLHPVSGATIVEAIKDLMGLLRVHRDAVGEEEVSTI